MRQQDNALKEKYKKMHHAEKVTVGSALVKVNSGVAETHDLQIVAEFLKGSSYLTKAGHLESLIDWLHDDPEEKKKIKKSIAEGTRSISKKLEISDGQFNALLEYPEDSEITVREKIKY